MSRVYKYQTYHHETQTHNSCQPLITFVLLNYSLISTNLTKLTCEQY